MKKNTKTNEAFERIKEAVISSVKLKITGKSRRLKKQDVIDF